MKKTVVLSLSALMLLSGCGTYAGAGAYAGASLGSVLGSAIGGIAGGPRGSDIGSLVGLAGGAMVGGAVGANADEKAQAYRKADDARFERKYVEHRSAATKGNTGGGYEDSGYDPDGRGDDVLYDFHGSDYTGNYTATKPEDVPHSAYYEDITDARVDVRMPLQVRNARFVDDNQDRSLNAGELSKVIFEIYNTSDRAVFDVQPMVVETTGNKNIHVSGTIHVESIMPGKGVRYTAMVKAGKRLKDGELAFRIYAVKGNNEIVSNVSEFNIKASRK